VTFTWLWIVWLLAFAVIEGAALYLGHGRSLSDHIWKWFSIGVKGKFWRLRHVALLTFVVWLALHLLTGGLF
jgi:hypothetical protein